MAPTDVTTPGSPVAYQDGVPRHPSGEILPEPLRRTVAEIQELSRLPDGWDSYGARAVEVEAQGRAVALLAMLVNHIEGPVAPPTVGPSVNGGVVLRWEPGDREVVVTLLADGGDYYVADREGDHVWAEGEVGSLDPFVRRLARYLA